MTDKTDDYEPPNEAFQPNRQRVDIQVGCIVQHEGRVYRITQVLDFETAVGIDVEIGRACALRIGELRPVEDTSFSSTSSVQDLASIADEDWRIAEQRYAAIKPLLPAAMVGRQQVELRAKETGVNTATLYRWLNRYRAFRLVSALIPQQRGWKTGKNRIPAHAEEVVKEVIETFYLTPQRPTAQKAVTEVLRRCHARGIAAPGVSAIRERISNITEKRRLRERGYKEKAKNKFLPAAGKFPNADYPLAVVQIDHTPADIILVDDLYRRPIGRPWITLAMDVNTRMVVGYYLSFDPPSETSVGLCVAHAALPKDEWLLLHKVEAEWPVWGFPRTIHVDNGADFRSNNFQRSCMEYGINLEFRPVKQPRYGGHIERILGTLLKEIHDLPGTTFSSINEKAEYDPEKHATMTKSEFEAWLVTLICKVYHKRIHSSLGMTPLRKWEIGIFGNAEVQGIGPPARPADRQVAMLNFLPAFTRTVQRFGVAIDALTYYAEALRPWINATDPETPGKKREFIFRRDPRDISTIWFYDPVLKEYFKVPFADQALPAISIWEYQQVRATLRRDGRASVNNSQLLQAITELRVKVEETQEKTKKARRAGQRRKEHEKKISPAAPPLEQPSTPTTEAMPKTGFADGDITDYGDIS